MYKIIRLFCSTRMAGTQSYTHGADYQKLLFTIYKLVDAICEWNLNLITLASGFHMQ